jgi:hypothetical protein
MLDGYQAYKHPTAPASAVGQKLVLVSYSKSFTTIAQAVNMYNHASSVMSQHTVGPNQAWMLCPCTSHNHSIVVSSDSGGVTLAGGQQGDHHLSLDR